MEYALSYYHSIINDPSLTEPQTIQKEPLETLYSRIKSIQLSNIKSIGEKILTEFLEYSPEEITEEGKYIVGRTKYFFSYNQNLLEHLLEVSILSSNFAAQLNLDILSSKRASFFHDIGKIDTQYSDHVVEGEKIAHKLGLEEYIVEAIKYHHTYNYQSIYPYLTILRAMDKLSAGRLGARPFQLEKTRERNSKIEAILSELSGISNIEFAAGGHIIKITLSIETFRWAELTSLKKNIIERLKNGDLNYQYNYQIEFQLRYSHIFYIEDPII